MSDQNRISPASPLAPASAPPSAAGPRKAPVGELLQEGAAPEAVAQARAQLRDSRQLKTALDGDAGAIRTAFEAGLVNDTIDESLRQLSTNELRRLTLALPESGRGPDSRVALASLISRMPGLPFDNDTKRLLRETLVRTGYQGDIDRFDLAYPIH